MAARRHLTGWIIAAIASLVASVALGQDANRTVLIFLDDLHIEFRNTPRLRTGLHQATERLLTAGRPIAMVSDGPSSISIRATTEATLLLPVANRISGSGLKPSETQNPTPNHHGRKETAGIRCGNDVSGCRSRSAVGWDCLRDRTVDPAACRFLSRWW